MDRSVDKLHDTVEKACAILEKTNDGNLLDPSDLKLTELAVNGYLNDASHEVFETLYQRVIDGNYTKPYVHGIEHLTRDHEGYIYYKGIHVEHYSRDYVYSECAKNDLMELKRRCEFLEHKGIKISSVNVIWGWSNYDDEYGAERQKKLESILGQETKGLLYSQVKIYNSGVEDSYFVCGNPKGLDDIKDHPVTKSMIGHYSGKEYIIKVESFIYGKRQQHNLIALSEIRNKSEVESLLASCHSYLKRTDRLITLPVVNYKTDFAHGYANTKLLDGLINNPGRSLQYSEVFMYGYGSDQNKLYFCGIPTFDEIKEYFEYKMLREKYGDRLNVSVTTYQYGNGEPLTSDEIKPFLTDSFIETLGETHYYLQKHDLSHETGWKDYARDVEVKRVLGKTVPGSFERKESGD